MKQNITKEIPGAKPENIFHLSNTLKEQLNYTEVLFLKSSLDRAVEMKYKKMIDQKNVLLKELEIKYELVKEENSALIEDLLELHDKLERLNKFNIK